MAKTNHNFFWNHIYLDYSTNLETISYYKTIHPSVRGFESKYDGSLVAT